MAPLGQVLARLGTSRYYLKEVRDDEVRAMVEQLGGRVVELRKNNLDIVKRQLRDDQLSDEVTAAWHEFEERLNRCLPPEVLDRIFWGTVVVVERVA
jgi:hypothetical protein